MSVHLAPKVKDKQAKQWTDLIHPYLAPGEELVMLAHARAPGADVLAVTNARILAFATVSMRSGPRNEVFLQDTQAVEIAPRGRTLSLVSKTGERVAFGTISSAAVDDVLAQLETAIDAGADVDVYRGIVHEREQAESGWAETRFIEKPPRKKALQLIKEHCGPGEAPWLVVHATGQSSGELVAFRDRCMIIKTGAMTGFMAGGLGGARVTTFYYRDVTGVEYNSGMLTGVLEILTSSYQGSANKDFWRGTLSSLNADSNNPFTLSNALPMDKSVYAKALPYINQMRAMITQTRDAGAQQGAGSASRPDASNMADELSTLAALHESGALTDAEFAEAKQQALRRSQG